jgi:hypothetical protein
VLNSYADLTAYHLEDAGDVTWDIWGNLQIDLLDRADRLAKPFVKTNGTWTSSTIFLDTGCSTWTMQLTATDFGKKPSPNVQYIICTSSQVMGPAPERASPMARIDEWRPVKTVAHHLWLIGKARVLFRLRMSHILSQVMSKGGSGGCANRFQSKVAKKSIRPNRP